MKKKTISHIIRLSIFIIFLWILSRLIDVNILKDVLQQVRIDVVLLAIGVYFFNILIRAYRFQIIINTHEKKIGLKDAYIITLVGIALNMVVPATLGDVARSYYGYRLYGIKEEMLSTTLVDKIFALSSLFILGTVSAYFMGYSLLCFVSLCAAVISFIPITFPQIIPWNLLNLILRRINRSLDSEKLLVAFRLPRPLKLAVMLISLAGWLCTCVFFYVLCQAFPVSVSLGYVIAIMPILTIVRLFPFTVNALGPMEVAVAYFFSVIGINSTLAVFISLSSNVIASIIPGIVGFFIILVYGHQEDRQSVEDIVS